MWEAFFAFHLAQGSAELGRCSICQRVVRPLAVVFLAPVNQDSAYVIECAEPARVQALITKTSVEAFDVSVLHRPARLDAPNLSTGRRDPEKSPPPSLTLWGFAVRFMRLIWMSVNFIRRPLFNVPTT